MNISGHGNKQEFAENVKAMILALFNGDKLPAKIKGSSSQIKVFTQAVFAECAYLRLAMQFGEEHPNTVRTKSELNSAIRRFERVTGIEWPIR